MENNIFTIGDNIRNKNYPSCKGKIEKFKLNDDNTISVFYGMGHDYLKDVKHYKKPLFTTEDGVDIFNISDTYFMVDNWTILPQTYNLRKNHKHFSTKEKAEEYITLHKPCISINEVLIALGWFKNCDAAVTLKKLVNGKGSR